MSGPSTSRASVHDILLVEDNPESALELKHSLESGGYRVTIAKDGGQAQASFVMRKPDLVLLDLILPGASGFEVCDRMKRTDESVPVVILSVIDMDASRDLADRVGADGYLIKPCPREELIAQIKLAAQAVWDRFHADESRDGARVKFTCRCGKRFKVSGSHRGKTLTCPACGEPLTVPRHD